jgi:hypothetical protein
MLSCDGVSFVSLLLAEGNFRCAVAHEPDSTVRPAYSKNHSPHLAGCSSASLGVSLTILAAGLWLKR